MVMGLQADHCGDHEIVVYTKRLGDPQTNEAPQQDSNGRDNKHDYRDPANLWPAVLHGSGGI